jgi:hypothetical protein
MTGYRGKRRGRRDRRPSTGDHTMTQHDTAEHDTARYNAAMHAVQSGVAMEIESGGEAGQQTTPKHLRVGVNAALVGNAAIARILIERGICTLTEYTAALATEAEAEQHRYEQRLSAELGTHVTLS